MKKRLRIVGYRSSCIRSHNDLAEMEVVGPADENFPPMVLVDVFLLPYASEFASFPESVRIKDVIFEVEVRPLRPANDFRLVGIAP